MKEALSYQLLEAMRIERASLFSGSEDQLPTSEKADAMIPQIGFVGPEYAPGDDLLLGINPGGGGASYQRTVEDAVLLPKIASIRSGHGKDELLADLFNQYAANMKTWNLWRIVLPVLEACGRNQSQIAYLNWCPFRTEADKMPRAATMRRCKDLYLLPLVHELKPSRVIALGKKAGNWLEKTSLPNCRTFVVPRTIGDSYVSEEACNVLGRIRG